MEIVYIRGGSPSAPSIAAAAGMRYGIRNDYTAYAPVWMLDIKWRNVKWDQYMDKVRELKPVRALVADYEQPDRDKLTAQINDLSILVDRVMVCPKFAGALDHIPSSCIVALSVPSTYAGWLPEDLNQLAGREIHLLGGKPYQLARLIHRLNGVGANVASVDFSYHAMKAGHGQWWDGGEWVQLRAHAAPTVELERESAIRIADYLRRARGYAQLGLGI